MKNQGHVVSLITLTIAAICLYLSGPPLAAQTVNGTILGLVRDPQGAAIPKADISARNLETGVTRNTTADDSGDYRIVSVPAGSYELTASAPGFKTEVHSGIVVTVGSDVSLDFALVVGAVNDTIQVTAEAPQVDTSGSTLGGFVNSETIRELPLNGRDWIQLTLLQPGVTLPPQYQADASRPQRGLGLAVSLSGGRPTDNSFRIDGIIVNDYANAGPGNALHSNMGVDAIREFSVLTNNYSAEFGLGSGGIVNAITKSGTNEIHGSAYYFIRNSDLDARNFFDGLTIPPFRRNAIGGAVGGKIKKDKTFFFVNYEGLTQLKSLSSSVDTLSANAHNGILCANAACTQTTQININPKVLPYLALFPIPNGPLNGNTGKFIFPQESIGHENYVIGHLDHYFSPATTLSGSYSYDNTSYGAPDVFDLKLLSSPTRRQNLSLSLQHIISPTLINITRVGVSRTWAVGSLDSNPNNPALTDPSLGFIPGENVGTVAISGVSGTYAGIGATSYSIWGYTTPQAYDDLSWTKGRNSFRTGVSFERVDYNLNSPNAPSGGWTFSSVQNFLQGIPATFASDFPGTNADRGERSSIYGGYIQDDFRMRPNFTINLGLRYEMGTVITEVNGLLATLRTMTDPNPAVGNPYYHNPTTKDFAPRVGFAWDPFKNGKTAIRGGGGIFDILPLPYLFQSRIARSVPFYQQGSVSNPPPSSFPNNIFPLLTENTLKTVNIEFNPAPSYRAQWNLNIQRQLTNGLALTVGYVGSVGVHLAHGVQDANQVPASLVTWNGTNLVFPIPASGQPIPVINPHFSQIVSTYWNGHSTYHALQANLVQRPIKGLTYQIAYTWSKSIDNGSTTFNDNSEYLNSLGQTWAFDDSINRGVSDFNIPQNLVAHFQYDVPVPGAVKTHHFVNTLLGGWQVGGIYTIQSGGAFSLMLGSDRAGTGNIFCPGCEPPNYVNAPGCSPDAVTGNIGHYIMTQCFAFPAKGQLGNYGRNLLRMPVFRDLDLSLFKNQNLWGEKLKAQLRIETFNIMNNTNLAANRLVIYDGSGNLTSGFGTPSSPTANSSRQIQFGLRILF